MTVEETVERLPPSADSNLYRTTAGILQTDRALTAAFRQKAAKLMLDNQGLLDALIHCERLAWAEGMTMDRLCLEIRRTVQACIGEEQPTYRLESLQARVAELEGALRRLASPAAFTVPWPATAEETARMKYAEAALARKDTP